MPSTRQEARPPIGQTCKQLERKSEGTDYVSEDMSAFFFHTPPSTPERPTGRFSLVVLIHKVVPSTS